MAGANPTSRDRKRVETRKRVFDAAVAEFKRQGLAAADVNAIVAAAGVARGTFYFHFPTKEHVLAELQRADEARISTELQRFLAEPHDLAAVLTETARLIASSERRHGAALFRDMFAFHFLPSRPEVESWSVHPVIVLVIEAIERAKGRGEVYPEADAEHSGLFFLLGIYGLLGAMSAARATRTGALDKFVETVLRSLEPR